MARRIQFISAHGMREVEVPAVGLVFQDKEVKEVSDSIADILLTNIQFVDADTGANPNFLCAACGVVVPAEGFLGPHKEYVAYRDSTGHRMCPEDFVLRHPEWLEWHHVLRTRGKHTEVPPPEPMDVFLKIAQDVVELRPTLGPTYATYRLGTESVNGSCVIDVDETFHTRATFEADLSTCRKIERRFTPGQIPEPSSIGSIDPADGTWRATGVVSKSHQQLHNPGEPAKGRITSRVETLITKHSLSDAKHIRWIINGPGPNGAWTWRGALVQVNDVSTTDNAEQVRSVLVFGKSDLSEPEANALWDTLCFLEGRNIQQILTETYAEDGSLINRIRRVGNRPTEDAFPPFAYSGLDVTFEQVGAIHEAFTRMHENRFDISRILDHSLLPVGGHLVHEALHLSIAAHAIMAELDRYWKRNPRRRPLNNGDRERGQVMSAKLFLDRIEDLANSIETKLAEVDVPERVKANIRGSVKRSNDLSMGERLAKTLAEIGLFLDEDDTRALGHRNKIVHEGAFPSDFVELTYEEQNVRLADVGRLRNIVTEAILRLCGYSGVVDDFTFPGGSRLILNSKASPFE
jgi:hypothetical protein